MKYRKKPVVVDAYQWDGEFTDDLIRLEDDGFCDICNKPRYEHGWIKTLEGGHIVCPGDWIITGVKGEKYPCKPDIFQETYEAVNE
jgi:hypothetical protein